MFGYELQDWWNDGLVRNAAYFRFPFFFRAFMGFLGLIIGINFIRALGCLEIDLLLGLSYVRKKL
jgi:hypothetical protein